MTIANGNELVFSSAVLAIGASQAYSLTFLVMLVATVSMTALAFDLVFARVASSAMASRLLLHGRRFLEAALGLGFSRTGVALLKIV